MSAWMVYDLEIAREVKDTPGGWGNPYGMTLGSAVVFDYSSNQFHFFLHDTDKPRLLEFLNGNSLISFNGLNFDTKVLLGNDRVFEPLPNGIGFKVTSADGKISWNELDLFTLCLKSKFECVDLMEATHKRSRGGMNLDAISKATLGDKFGKSGDGAEAPRMYKAGKYLDLLSYNLQDVRLTRQICEFAKQNKYLMTGKGDKLEIKFGGASN